MLPALVDTSVWVQHLRSGEPDLVELLEHGHVLMHPFVIGELGCGNLKDREQILSGMQDLPEVVMPTWAEVMALVEERRLWGRGIGWIDANLLAAARLTRCCLWTLDKSLAKAASIAGVPHYRKKHPN